MRVLAEEHKEHLREFFEKNTRYDAHLILFTQETKCNLCRNTRELLMELSSLSPKIRLEVYGILKDNEKAKYYEVDKVPCIAISGTKTYGIRFYGLPFGYEFNPLTESIVNVSKDSSNISERSKIRLRSIPRSVHIEVFVTPTCPYYGMIAELAYQFAIENTMIRLNLVEITEFPELAQKYNFVSVPKVVINRKSEFIGAVPEDVFVEFIMTSVGMSSKSPQIYM
jgi:glutaredoxin-like protein